MERSLLSMSVWLPALAFHIYMLRPAMHAEIPFHKAVAGVRVGWVDNAPVVNPTVSG